MPRPRVALGIALAPLALLVLSVLALPWPLPDPGGDPFYSTVLADRSGRELRAVRDPGAGRARWVPLGEIADTAIRATLAGEDRRFFSHPGVDPLAVARAARQGIGAGRVVSGASTLTMQLVRNLSPHGGGLWGKGVEAWRALRLERSATKVEILEAYLNRVYYGRLAYGIEAAAGAFLARPASHLSLAEAAFLAVLPRAPSAQDPYLGADAALARRDALLRAMPGRGLADEEEVRAALAEPLRLRRPVSAFEAPHFVDYLLPTLGDLPRGARVGTTLDLSLQEDLQLMVLRHLSAVEEKGISQAAVVVLDVPRGEVLGMVGSASFDDPEAGQVNGATAPRQPGSTLKPFTYALAFEDGLHPGTVLPDLEVHYATFKGDWEPENYDRAHRGPVRAREALASSLNVPAVRLLEGVGAPRALGLLRALGLHTLTRSPEHYGLGLTLGAGEVRLVDLAAAYRALARGGLWSSPRTLRSLADPGGAPLPLPPLPGERRVLDPRAAFLVTDVLADAAARAPTFGRRSVLDLPFPCAVKTGTSRGYRDNWTVGYTPEVVVAVWAGNFDARAMGEVSGVTGAGPLFRDAMLRAMRDRPRRPFERPSGLRRADLCVLSGDAATALCPGRVGEWVGAEASPPACGWHRQVAVDVRTGLLAGPACPESEIRREVAAVLPPEYRSWAARTGFPHGPDRASPRCPPTPDPPSDPPARARSGLSPRGILYPPEGAVFALDDELPDSAQVLHLRAAPPPGTDAVRWTVDGREIASPGPPFDARWPLRRGTHRVVMRASRGGATLAEEAVGIEVR
ncbi:penicillin-binding protein 1C [Myxococcota bacterium]|nr:penicillin-binding protein 1C [Myxococcota bacterium]